MSLYSGLITLILVESQVKVVILHYPALTDNEKAKGLYLKINHPLFGFVLTMYILLSMEKQSDPLRPFISFSTVLRIQRISSQNGSNFHLENAGNQNLIKVPSESADQNGLYANTAIK